jgi:MSHA biogenesis protein MshL
MRKTPIIPTVVLLWIVASWATEEYDALPVRMGSLKIIQNGNIRVDPINGATEVAGRVVKGQSYKYDKFLGGRWYRIIDQTGTAKGWIYKSLVKVVEPCTGVPLEAAPTDTTAADIATSNKEAGTAADAGFPKSVADNLAAHFQAPSSPVLQSPEIPTPPAVQPSAVYPESTVNKPAVSSFQSGGEKFMLTEGTVFRDSIPSDTIPGDSMYKPRVTFKAKNTDLIKALSIFAQSNGLKLRYEASEKGKVTVSLNDVSLSDAMDALLKGYPLAWHLEGPELVVTHQAVDTILQPQEIPFSPPASMMVIGKTGTSRMFEINYPRLHRSGSGSNSVSINSSGSGSGNVSLTTGDDLVFWQEIDEQLKQLIGKEGKLVINRLGGIIYVSSDKEQILDAVQHFLDAVVTAATRQVEITARIYEVTLNHDHSLGIDWNSVSTVLARMGQNYLTGKILTDVIQTSADTKAATFAADLTANNGVELIVKVLEEQGTVKTVSQPRVMTLNNQPALVKIGTDYPYFSSNVSYNQTTNQKDVAEQIRTITVGVVLSVTPQISNDGWITLGIDPMISNLVSTATSLYGSTAPIIDVKQSSALVRLKDRHTVRISGLLQAGARKAQRKVPILGDIPFLGKLFQWNYNQETNKELVIFITPRIL